MKNEKETTGQEILKKKIKKNFGDEDGIRQEKWTKRKKKSVEGRLCRRDSNQAKQCENDKAILSDGDKNARETYVFSEERIPAR